MHLDLLESHKVCIYCERASRPFQRCILRFNVTSHSSLQRKIKTPLSKKKMTYRTRNWRAPLVPAACGFGVLLLGACGAQNVPPEATAPEQSEIVRDTAAAAAEPLACDYVPLAGGFGIGPDGNAWLDLQEVRDFPAGSQIRLKTGGNAQEILVRLLPDGEDPNEAVGVVGGFAIPEDREIAIVLDEAYSSVVQVSIHGGQPWEFVLEGQNGAPTLQEVAICS